jgi:hypothetical protein
VTKRPYRWVEELAPLDQLPVWPAEMLS